MQGWRMQEEVEHPNRKCLDQHTSCREQDSGNSYGASGRAGLFLGTSPIQVTTEGTPSPHSQRVLIKGQTPLTVLQRVVMHFWGCLLGSPVLSQSSPNSICSDQPRGSSLAFSSRLLDTLLLVSSPSPIFSLLDTLPLASGYIYPILISYLGPAQDMLRMWEVFSS